MCKNCINYLKGKVWNLVSLIINLIFGILLFVWRFDESKTKTINAIDKLIHYIIDLFVLLKDAFCCKKVKDLDNEIDLFEEGKRITSTISERSKIILKLNKFVKDNANKKEGLEKEKQVEKAKEFLTFFKIGEQLIINSINVV